MDISVLSSSATRNSGLACPKCMSLSFRKHGKHLGIQRYCCKKCGKTFKETVNSPLHGIHKKTLIPRYIQTMLEQLSLRAAAKTLNISESTSFRWRHKLLSSLTAQTGIMAASPSGIAQIRIPHSFKGKRNIPDITLPSTRTIIVTDASGRTRMHHLQEKNHTLAAAVWLAKVIPDMSLLACAPVNIIKKAVRATGRRTVLFTAEKKRMLAQTSKTIHQIQDWMARFRGVASKYLHQYWNWFCAEKAAPAESFIEECLGQRQLHHYRRILAE